MLAARQAAVTTCLPDPLAGPCPPQVPNNNEILWSSVWSEGKESGVCTGLPQNQWMSLAVQLRQLCVAALLPCTAVLTHAVRPLHAAVWPRPRAVCSHC